MVAVPYCNSRILKPSSNTIQNLYPSPHTYNIFLMDKFQKVPEWEWEWVAWYLISLTHTPRIFSMSNFEKVPEWEWEWVSSWRVHTTHRIYFPCLILKKSQNENENEFGFYMLLPPNKFKKFFSLATLRFSLVVMKNKVKNIFLKLKPWLNIEQS